MRDGRARTLIILLYVGVRYAAIIPIRAWSFWWSGIRHAIRERDIEAYDRLHRVGRFVPALKDEEPRTPEDPKP